MVKERERVYKGGRESTIKERCMTEVMQKREAKRNQERIEKCEECPRETGTDAWDRGKACKRGKETLHNREEEKAYEREQKSMREASSTKKASI